MDNSEARKISIEAARNTLINSGRDEIVKVLTDSDIEAVLKAGAPLYVGRGVMPPKGSPEGYAIIPRTFEPKHNEWDNHNQIVPYGHLPFKTQSWKITSYRWFFGNLEFASEKEFDAFLANTKRSDLYIISKSLSEAELLQDGIWEYGYQDSYETTAYSSGGFGYSEDDDNSPYQRDSYSQTHTENYVKGPFQSTYKKVIEEACADDKWWGRKDRWIKAVTIKSL